MFRANGRQKWLVLLLLLVLGWSLYRLMAVDDGGAAHGDAVKELYKVSFFHIELLSGLWLEAGKTDSAEELDLLQQAAYAANFTHERFVLAMGAAQVTSLESIPMLLQYILKLQIRGGKELDEAERKVLDDTAALFQQIKETYEQLLSEKGTVFSSQNGQLRAIDRNIAEMLREKMLD
jgi:hypothetical protein